MLLFSFLFFFPATDLLAALAVRKYLSCKFVMFDRVELTSKSIVLINFSPVIAAF